MVAAAFRGPAEPIREAIAQCGAAGKVRFGPGPGFGREALMSTGVGKGLALPHARTAAVRETVAAFAVTAEPVDYHALDGQAVRLVFLLCGPEGERGSHITLLSRVSRLMNDDAFRARLQDAPDAATVLAAFREAEERIG